MQRDLGGGQPQINKLNYHQLPYFILVGVMISSVSTHPSGADTQRDITSTSDGTAGHQDVLDSIGG